MSPNKCPTPSIVIAGAGSCSGKTRVAEIWLHYNKSWAAIKISKLEPSKEVDNKKSHFRIISDENILNQPGKDTQKLLQAGACQVLLIKTNEQALPEAFHEALKLLKPSKGLIIEGTSILKYFKPNLAILTLSTYKHQLKPSAIQILPKIDLVVVYYKELSSAALLQALQKTAFQLYSQGLPIITIDNSELSHQPLITYIRLALGVQTISIDGS